MPTGEGTPLSLRPFPVADKKPKNLVDFIAQVNAQPGGFRALSEVKLHQNFTLLHQNGSPDDDLDLSDPPDDDDEDDAIRDPMEARIELVKNIDIAGNTALLTLDFLSLLLSKQNPTQAGATLSTHLRELVGIGTMGADRLQGPNATEDKDKDQEDVAQGWTIMEINKTRDDAEIATAFLKNEVEAESKYWEEIMRVQKNGWAVCRMPQERHTLGVRFGFSESAPEFARNGLAPMRRGDQGSAQLDCGRLVSERIVVTCEMEGRLVGRSALPAQTDNTAPLEARVLEARNTLFSQELWYELNREARTLAAYDVRQQHDTIVCLLDKTTKLTFQLVPLDSSPSDLQDLPDSNVTELMSLALHMLLSFTHRNNELMRIRPMPPQASRSRGKHPYPLLRPIIARTLHNRYIESCTKYVGGLVRSLQNAGINASFILNTQQPSAPGPQAAGPNQLSHAHVSIRNMVQPMNFSLKITLLPGTPFTIHGRTILYPFIATSYRIVTPQGSQLQTISPPYNEGYPDFTSLSDYLRTTTARLLASYCLSQISNRDWTLSMSGTSLCHVENVDYDLSFIVEEEDSLPVLHFTSALFKDDSSSNNKWRWRSTENNHESKPLLDAVHRAANQTV